MNANYEIDYPDAHYLNAAEGWLELGNCLAANEELDQICPALRVHPDVLMLRWHINVRAENWKMCLIIAHAMVETVPDDSRGWVAFAETHYFRGQIRSAYVIATSKLNAFPRSWQLFYDSARYACLLGKRWEAGQHLQRAMLLGDAEAIRQSALEDPDLSLLWKRRIPASTSRRREAATVTSWTSRAAE